MDRVAKERAVMSRIIRLISFLTLAGVLSIGWPALAGEQGRRRPGPPPPQPIVRGHVFVGGYFYDPFFGPYPWWPRTQYPWYLPIYDTQAYLKIDVEPEDAAVYIDGYYAGIADDFDGFFENLPLTPGGHTIVVYLNGYRSIQQSVHVPAGGTFKIKGTLEPLAPGEVQAPPPVAPALPAPPAGSYRLPRPPVERPAAAVAVTFGELDVRVQPADVNLSVDGQRWLSSDPNRFLLQLPTGRHKLEITKAGYRGFTSEVDVTEAGSVLLNISLVLESR
jgi:hypothetical protein